MADRSDLFVQPATEVLVFTKGSGGGGVERIALRLAGGWRDAGFVVAHAVSPTWRGQPEWLEMLRLLRATLRAVRERRPAVLFCPGNAYAGVAILLKLLLRNRCPPIVAKISNDLHRSDLAGPLRPLYRLWLRLQGRVIDEFAALSPAMAREVVALMGVSPARVHVVPNPVLSRAEIDEDAARPMPAIGDGRRFVAVGRLEAQKDFALMLHAFARGGAAADTLTILGEGRERPALERLAAALGIAARVRFAGYCAIVRDQLARHDVLLLSSAYEGLPGVVVEALSVGLGVVATRSSAGMDDLLEGGALGRLVPPGDEAAFARAITAARVGTQDRARARAKADGFTLEAAVPTYAALFATAIARTRDPRRAANASRWTEARAA
jgi:glycosyltransferase involved in cell wall biosynthesis